MERKRTGEEVERKRKGGTRIGHPEQKPSNRSTEAQKGLATQNASLTGLEVTHRHSLEMLAKWEK